MSATRQLPCFFCAVLGEGTAHAQVSGGSSTPSSGVNATATSGIVPIRAVTGVPSVNSDYRALAHWPEYLGRAWASLQAARAQDAYRSLEREIRLMAEQAVLVLPFRIEINPHVMRLCGLDEEEIDDVRATIERYYRALPGLVVNMAFLSVGAFGRADAARSPFPIDLSR